jgi:hypothetical protein
MRVNGGTEGLTSEFASTKKSGATQRPRREEHAAPPVGTPAVTLLEGLIRQETRLTLRRTKRSESAGRCLFKIAHLDCWGLRSWRALLWHHRENTTALTQTVAKFRSADTPPRDQIWMLIWHTAEASVVPCKNRCISSQSR